VLKKPAVTKILTNQIETALQPSGVTTSLPSVEATAKIVSAWVKKNHIPAAALPGLITVVSSSLRKAASGSPTDVTASTRAPAVPRHQSVTDEWIICLEDGLKFKSLKRHLRRKYGLTPDEYRSKWGLPSSYPMVAPAYSRRRSALTQRLIWNKKADGAQ